MRYALGIPTVGNVVTAFDNHLAVAVELGRMGEVVIATPNNVLPHDRVRELIVDIAIEQECDRLLFMDSDTGAGYGDASKLASTMDSVGAQVAAGHYFQRGYPYACIWARMDNGVSSHVDAMRGVHEIHGAGMGFTLVDVLWCKKHLQRPWFKIEDVDGQPRLWEDFYFCKKVYEAGGCVIGDADVRVVHVGDGERIDDMSVDLLRQLYLKRHPCE